MARLARALSAALILGCGGISASPGHGGTARAGSAGSGTMADGASAGTGGASAGTGGASAGGAGGASAGRAGAANTGVCPDYEPPMSALTTGVPCRSDGDCPTFEHCLAPGEVDDDCGVCFPQQRPCETATDCGAGDACFEYAFHCTCEGDGFLSTRCVPACHDDSCDPVFERCATSGLCEPRPCDDGYDCPAGLECSPGEDSVDPHGCLAIRCDAGFDCPPNTYCDPELDGHGCVSLPCGADADCDCGACVDGACASGPGICAQPAI